MEFPQPKKLKAQSIGNNISEKENVVIEINKPNFYSNLEDETVTRKDVGYGDEKQIDIQEINMKTLEKVKSEKYIGRTKGVFTSDKARKTISYNINSKTVEQLNDLKNYWVEKDIKNHTQYTLGYVMHLIVKEALDSIQSNNSNPDYLIARFTVREKTNLKPRSFFIMNRDEFENDLNKARTLLKEYTNVELDRTKSIACFINGVHRKLISNS